MGRKRQPKSETESKGLFPLLGSSHALKEVPPELRSLKPTVVYDTYWRFAAERQNIFFRRAERRPPPWTADAVLRANKFTNVYRASDRVSQYLIRKVIYRDDLPGHPTEVVFRVMLFKIFNKIATWELLEGVLGPLVYAYYSFERYDKVLSAALERGEKIYSAAYIMPSAGSFGEDRKHRNHLKLIERMMVGELPARLADAPTMRAAFDLIRGYPTIGEFLAYQYAIDVNYSPVTNFSESEFVAPGPGAIDGIRKCFGATGGMSDSEVIQLMVARQEAEFNRLGLGFRNLYGRRLQSIDCQNLFCEVDKYARVAHPEVVGVSGRSRIKQRFHPHTEEIDYWYPPKWGINAQVAKFRALLTSSNLRQEKPMDFEMYQKRAAKTDRNPEADPKGITISLAGLAGEAGEVLSEYKKLLRHGDSHVLFKDRFAEELGDVLWYLANTATKFDLNLTDIARRNLEKAEARWGELPQRRQFDADCPESQRFPRRFVVDFNTIHDEKENPKVSVTYKGKRFGDVLDDNSFAKDGYGYHDALHLSFAAVLGWSPMTRKYLGVKRKAEPDIDRVEDGGRAIATEEGLTAMIFAHARDYNWLEGKSSVSTELLRMIKNMTAHLEVSVCTTGEWEQAIIQGMAVWREIKARGAGALVVNLDERRIHLKDNVSEARP